MSIEASATSSAAQVYLDEARELISWMVEAYSDIAKAHFNFQSGELVVQLKPEIHLPTIQLHGIFDRFNERKVYVSGIKVMNNAMTATMRFAPNEGDPSQRSLVRMMQLVDQDVNTGPKLASPDTLSEIKKAFPSDRDMVFAPKKKH